MKYRTVWILGAGFSRALGGPLLRDLLTPECIDNVRAAFPAHEGWLDADRKRVLVIYDTHKYRDERAPGQRLWRDAEEFIDYVDTAAELGGPAKSRLLPFVSGDPRPEPLKVLAWAARSMVAAECSAFLVDADPRTERWEPYVRWFQTLGPCDTVITFNYDRVIEKLEAHSPGKIHIATPGNPCPKERTAVLKLHGSVDWKRVEGKSLKIDPGYPDAFPLTAGPSELTVATPGPTKRARSRELEELWISAETAIRSATAVVFVGYRFPPTDASARLRLLRALTANESLYLAVHSVLGPRVKEDDPVRMLNLLSHAMLQAHRSPAPSDRSVTDSSHGKLCTVVQHPLFAEDFLGYVQGGHIWQANLHYDSTEVFLSRPRVPGDG